MEYKETDFEAIKLRIELAKDTQRRCRFSFLASTVVSIAILVAAWNGTFSWYSNFALKDEFSSNEVVREAQLHLLKNWVQSLTISLQPFGTFVGISDASVLGSLSLCIISLWFFFNIRRENHTIAILLRDTKAASNKLKDIVFHGIVSSLVFTTVTKHDNAITSLNQHEVQKPSYIARKGVSLLIYLPAITILFVFITDVLTLLYFPAPFRFPHEPLVGLLGKTEWTRLAIMEIIRLILGTIAFFLCHKVSSFDKATSILLEEYSQPENNNQVPQQPIVSATTN